jgi:hypothetical protein
VINNYPEVINLSPASTAVFVQYYNKNIPEAFPRATLKALEKFQILHPSLFKESRGWTIDRHRKKLIDWLSSYKEEEEV